MMAIAIGDLATPCWRIGLTFVNGRAWEPLVSWKPVRDSKYIPTRWKIRNVNVFGVTEGASWAEGFGREVWPRGGRAMAAGGFGVVFEQFGV